MEKSSKVFEELKKSVWNELENLDERLYYHGRHHTFDDVLPQAIFLGEKMKLSPSEMKIVKTAALFHDTGFLDQYEKNEPFGAKRAKERLSKYPKEYSNEEIERICKCIELTEVPQKPGDDVLCQVVCDADLGHIGKEDGKYFFLRSETLRMELKEMKNLKDLSPRKWNTGNLKFLESQKYHTKIANEYWKQGRDRAIRETKELLGLI